MATSYLGLGSNLGDRAEHLRTAVRALAELDPGLRVSSVYETAPVGGPSHQGAYLNCVVGLDTPLTPRELLDVARRLEEEARRVRTVRNGPRTLDVDVLLVGDVTLDEPDLVLPHPRMAERAFVLAPLEEIAPHRVPEGWRGRLATSGPTGDLGSDVRRVGTLFPS